MGRLVAIHHALYDECVQDVWDVLRGAAELLRFPYSCASAAREWPTRRVVVSGATASGLCVSHTIHPLNEPLQRSTGGLSFKEFFKTFCLVRVHALEVTPSVYNDASGIGVYK